MPASWPLEETWLELAPGGEGLLRVGYGDRSDAFGLDPWHRRFPLQEREFTLSVEAEARLPFGKPNPRPRLESARLVWSEPGLERLVRRLGLVAGAAAGLGSDDAADRLLTAAEAALARFEWPSATEPYVGRAAHGRELAELWSPPRPPEPPEPLPASSRQTIRLAEAVLRLFG